MKSREGRKTLLGHYVSMTKMLLRTGMGLYSARRAATAYEHPLRELGEDPKGVIAAYEGFLGTIVYD